MSTPDLTSRSILDLLMSHHTGTQLMTLSLQTVMLMNWMRHWVPLQKMYKTHPIFHAIQGSGKVIDADPNHNTPSKCQ